MASGRIALRGLSYSNASHNFRASHSLGAAWTFPSGGGVASRDLTGNGFAVHRGRDSPQQVIKIRNRQREAVRDVMMNAMQLESLIRPQTSGTSGTISLDGVLEKIGSSCELPVRSRRTIRLRRRMRRGGAWRPRLRTLATLRRGRESVDAMAATRANLGFALGRKTLIWMAEVAALYACWHAVELLWTRIS
jgi:hypothetical protein